MDPVRNPFAPGAGQRPPELAGRDREVDAFEIVLERVARGRPERSLVLTGLRGVGKTVLLGELRSMADARRLGRGQDRGPPGRRPAPSAVRRAAPGDPRPRRAPPRPRTGSTRCSACSRRSRCAPSPDGAKLRERWQPGIDVPVTNGRADSGDIEIDLVELFTEVAELAADVGTGVAILIDEMQDLRPDDVSALCAACHELSQSRAPLVVVGAGLPHLPAVLSASKSYSERLFTYARIGQLDREDADFALLAPAEREDATFDADALDALYERLRRLPLLRPGLRQGRLGRGAAQPDRADGRQDGGAGGRDRARGRLLRLPVRAGHPGRARVPAGDGRADRRAATSRSAPPGIAEHLERRASSLSPARDSLLKKGLVFSAQRGQIAFTVPHFGRYLLAQA